MFYEVEQENILDLAAFSDEKKRKARETSSMMRVRTEVCRRNELDMVSPDVTKIKPGSPRGGEDGYEADTTPVPVRKGRGKQRCKALMKVSSATIWRLCPHTSRSRISTGTRSQATLELADHSRRGWSGFRLRGLNSIWKPIAPSLRSRAPLSPLAISVFMDLPPAGTRPASSKTTRKRRLLARYGGAARGRHTGCGVGGHGRPQSHGST